MVSSHSVPMRLDYIFSSAKALEAHALHVKTVQHPITSVLSDHFPLEVVVSKKEARVGGQQTSQVRELMSSILCDETHLPCKYMDEQILVQKDLKANVARVAEINRGKWSREQAHIPGSPQNLTIPNSWQVSIGQAGENCDDVCLTSLSHNSSFPTVEQTGICVESAATALRSSCDRMVASFGCPLGCTWSSDERSEVPAQVVNIDNQDAGKCIVLKEDHQHQKRSKRGAAPGLKQAKKVSRVKRKRKRAPRGFRQEGGRVLSSPEDGIFPAPGRGSWCSRSHPHTARLCACASAIGGS
jgi:hypothetical protein